MDIDPIGAIEGEGWHANITRRGLRERPDLEPFVIQPATLRRVWAGDDPEEPNVTVALRFESEAEGVAALGLGGQE
jgi:hypothetical protein